MNNTSPFSFLAPIAARFQPPAWMVDEGQQRLVLFLNHVLLQEKQAQERLLRQKGRVAHIRWGFFAIDLVVTPAGLVDRAPASSKPDLVLSVVGDSPFAVAQAVLAGRKPPVKIEGDVQLAAEIGWLAENLRWDAEEDLSKLIGDAPAHALADAGRRLSAALKQFLAKPPVSQDAQTAAPDSTNFVAPTSSSAHKTNAVSPGSQAPESTSSHNSGLEVPSSGDSQTSAAVSVPLAEMQVNAAVGPDSPVVPGTAA